MQTSCADWLSSSAPAVRLRAARSAAQLGQPPGTLVWSGGQSGPRNASGVAVKLQPIAAGIVGCITGFASSFTLVIAGLQAVGASGEQAASGLFALCLAAGLTSILLSVFFKIPFAFAWSTPGAALLIAAGANSTGFAAAVGAFLVSAVLVVLCGLWPWLGRMITSIPRPIASAMLAGILFPICIAPVTASVTLPLLALPIVLTWLLLYKLAPRWAVPAAMVAAAVVIALSAGSGWLADASLSPQLSFVSPVFDPLVIVSIGLPLFIVTMAGQNVPGFAVMDTFGYRLPPRPALVGSGVASGVAALFGGHMMNLAAITAAIMASPESHPDRDRRWIASVTAGVGYILLGLGAGVAAALVSASPPILITAVAGLALLGALVTAITAALDNPEQRITAIATFLVTASGASILGIGSAFWGLLTGGVILLWLRLGVRQRAAP